MIIWRHAREQRFHNEGRKAYEITQVEWRWNGVLNFAN